MEPLDSRTMTPLTSTEIKDLQKRYKTQARVCAWGALFFLLSAVALFLSEVSTGPKAAACALYIFCLLGTLHIGVKSVADRNLLEMATIAEAKEILSLAESYPEAAEYVEKVRQTGRDHFISLDRTVLADNQAGFRSL